MMSSSWTEKNDALTKKLPGVDVDTDGTIRLNGKEVKSVLMNDKELLDNGDVFLASETNAEFPGGQEAQAFPSRASGQTSLSTKAICQQPDSVAEPIIVIDGKIVDLQKIDGGSNIYGLLLKYGVTKENVESVNMFMDDKGVAIWGDKAKNGVIEIKTKDGKAPELKQTDKLPVEGTHDSNGDEVLYVPEKMPEFKGGMSGLMAHLGSNIKYPALAQEIGLSGRVLVRFVVGKQGNVYDIKIAKSAGPENSADYKWRDKNNQPIAAPTGKTLEKFQKNYAEANKQLNAEAIRCIESTSGLWTPGTLNGEPVNVQYTLPISFRLR